MPAETILRDSPFSAGVSMPDIFLHIPKTGGMSLTTALKWVYGPWSSCSLPSGASVKPAQKIKKGHRSSLEDAEIVFGHVEYGIHRYVSGSCRYFTLLRHPVRRVVSHYYYHKRRYPSSSLAASSIREFLAGNSSIAQSNRQVRFLSGNDPDQDPESALQTAKAHLQDEIAVFGLTERFDESLLRFQRHLGWDFYPYYVPRKINNKRPSIEELPADVIQAVRDQNRLDLALYDFARTSFERALAAEFSNLEGALHQFRRRNQLIRKAAPPVLWIYHQLRPLFQRLKATLPGRNT